MPLASSPHSPRDERTRSLFGFCQDIIAIPDGFDFDDVDVLPRHEEIVDAVLADWDRQEPELVVGKLVEYPSRGEVEQV